MIRNMVIETDRLLIKPFDHAYFDEIQQAKEDVWDDLQMWMSWARDDMKPRAALDTYMGMLDASNPWDAAVAFTRDDGRFAVMGGLHTGGQGAGDFSTGYLGGARKRVRLCGRDDQCADPLRLRNARRVRCVFAITRAMTPAAGLSTNSVSPIPILISADITAALTAHRLTCCALRNDGSSRTAAA